MAGADGERKRQQKFFYFALAATLVVAGSMLLTILILRDYLIVYTFSSRYSLIAPCVPPLALGVVFYNPSFCLAHFFFARSDVVVTKSLLIDLLLQVSIFAIRHDSVTQLVYNQMVVYFLQLLLLLVHLARSRQKKRCCKY